LLAFFDYLVLFCTMGLPLCEWLSRHWTLTAHTFPYFNEVEWLFLLR